MLGGLGGCNKPPATTPKETAIAIVSPIASPIVSFTPVPNLTKENDAPAEATVTEVTTPSPTIAPAYAAMVNGQPILLADYERQKAQVDWYFQQQGVDPNSAEGSERITQARRQVLEQLIDQVLIEQGAAELGISITTAQLEARIAEIVAQLGGEETFEQSLAANQMTREDFAETLHSELLSITLADHIAAALPKEVEQIHAQHILVGSETQAQEVLAKLQQGANFGELAREYSQDQGSAPHGGDLGFFPRGLMSPEFEDAAFALDAGQVSGVVRSPFGFHIIKVLERDPARPMSPEMWQSMKQQAVMDWIQARRSQADIERFVTN